MSKKVITVEKDGARVKHIWEDLKIFETLSPDPRAYTCIHCLEDSFEFEIEDWSLCPRCGFKVVEEE